MDSENNMHLLEKLSTTPYYKNLKNNKKNGKKVNCRRRCNVCGNQTFFYCSTCSTNVQSIVDPHFICVCPFHKHESGRKKMQSSCHFRHCNGFSKEKNSNKKRQKVQHDT